MIRCGLCLTPYRARSADQIAAQLSRCAVQLLGLKEEAAFAYLRLNLRLLSAELGGLCANCTWERAAVSASAAPEVPGEEEIEAGRIGTVIHLPVKP